VSPTIFFELLKLSETSRARKLILGLQVNIGKVDSRRYDVIGGSWCGGAVPPPLILVLPVHL